MLQNYRMSSTPTQSLALTSWLNTANQHQRNRRPPLLLLLWWEHTHSTQSFLHGPDLPPLWKTGPYSAGLSFQTVRRAGNQNPWGTCCWGWCWCLWRHLSHLRGTRCEETEQWYYLGLFGCWWLRWRHFRWNWTQVRLCRSSLLWWLQGRNESGWGADHSARRVPTINPCLLT